VSVECSNCGGLGTEFWLSLVALLLAAVAGWYAKRSADHASEAVALARDEVEMAREEHNEFLRELRARARFRLSLSTWPEPDEDGVIREDATVVGVRVEVVLRNEGDRAAGETVLNVIGPELVWREFRWCGPNGEELPDALPPAPAPEELTDNDGRVWPARYLKLTLPRVSRRSPYARYARVSVEVPSDGVTSVPVRVTAQADELPDDVHEESERLMIRVALRRR
jgi:hypothetical protein